jgi:hypothetical protein
MDSGALKVSREFSVDPTDTVLEFSRVGWLGRSKISADADSKDK